jgi:hypothetical protein
MTTIILLLIIFKVFKRRKEMDKLNQMLETAKQFAQDHKNVLVPVGFGLVGALIGAGVAAVILKNEDLILNDLNNMAEPALNIDGTLLNEDEETEE